MTIVDSGTVKFCTDCRLKFDPAVSGEKCPNCGPREEAEKAAGKPEVNVEGRGR